MNIDLSPELELLVQRSIQAGGYHSASEVVRDALLLWDKHQGAEQELQGFRSRLDQRLTESEQIQAVDGEQFTRQMLEELDSRFTP